MQYREEIHAYIQAHKEEIIETLKELIKIPSVRGDAVENAPFGIECARILEFAEKLYKNNGFETEIDPIGGYLLSYFGKGEKTLGIFAHADVVPVSDDWILTSPFAPIEKDGFIVGRGTLDDKSAIITSLYCAKMFNELNIPFNSRLIMFTGSNEESGMADIKNYLSKHIPPKYSLVADTAFPLYRGNKGKLTFNLVSVYPLRKIKRLIASNAKGAILGEIKLVFEYDEELYDYLKSNENIHVSVKRENDEIFFEVIGISKHTALPEGSLNAGGLAFSILSKCEYLSAEDRCKFSFLAELLSNYYGESIDIQNTDEEFGKLTFVNDIIKLENGKLELHFDLRFGAKVNIKNLKEKICNRFSKNGFVTHFDMESTAKITDMNNPLVKSTLEAYKEYIGAEDAKVYVNAGGTYARYLPCAVEIGTTHIWGTPVGLQQGHGAVHQPDECISIDGFLEAMEITALMLLKCDKME